MSQVDKLLNSMSEDDIAYYTVDPASEEHIIVDSDRFITVPDKLKRIAVQYDHNIETVTFDCPRYWDNHDMSKMAIYVNFLCPNGAIGSAPTSNTTVDPIDDSVMHFDWTISGDVTHSEGKLMFLVCVKRTDENGQQINHWNSELNSETFISKGLELPDDYIYSNPDIVTKILLLYSEIIELNKTTIQRAAVYVGPGDMPDGYNVQIDPTGTDVYSLSNEELEYIVQLVLANIPSQDAIKIDTVMSDTSTNLVQNKVLKKYVDDLMGDVESAVDEINAILGVPIGTYETWTFTLEDGSTVTKDVEVSR